MRGGTLFVSSGIGTSQLPIRYGVPPEMVMVTLYSPGTPAASAVPDHSTGRKSGTDR
jgi:hypothetical protein